MSVLGSEYNERKELLNEMVRILPAARKVVGISQTELGQKIGVSRQTISSIERGTVQLSWQIFLSLMLFFCANYELYSDFLERETKKLSTFTKTLKVKKV